MESGRGWRTRECSLTNQDAHEWKPLRPFPALRLGHTTDTFETQRHRGLRKLRLIHDQMKGATRDSRLSFGRGPGFRRGLDAVEPRRDPRRSQPPGALKKDDTGGGCIRCGYAWTCGTTSVCAAANQTTTHEADLLLPSRCRFEEGHALGLVELLGKVQRRLAVLQM